VSGRNLREQPFLVIGLPQTLLQGLYLHMKECNNLGHVLPWKVYFFCSSIGLFYQEQFSILQDNPFLNPNDSPFGGGKL